jgi:hypothetical protein
LHCDATDSADTLDIDDGMGELRGACMHRHRGWERILRIAFAFGAGERWAIRCCLNVSPFLPKYAVTYLTARAGLMCTQDGEAVELLARCGSRHVYRLAAEALADRIESVGDDAVTEALAALLRSPVVQEFYYPKSVKMARSRTRERLASEDPAVRLRTINVLAWIGDLQDISLLADLATMPGPDEMRAEERTALVAAMEAISRRSVV